MLTLSLWLAIAVAGAAEEPSPKTWADRLASTKPDERFAAIDALDGLGLKALPALREAVRTTTGDARRHASEQIERIGTRRLLLPTMVSIEPRETSLTQALAALRSTSGFLIDIDPAKAGAPADPRIHLDSSGPLGFFETVDRIGQIGGFRHDPSPVYRYPALKGVRVRLVPFDAPPPPTSYAGPYRLTLISLNRHREVVQTRNPADLKVREDFTAKLEIEAEPGITIERNGPVRIQEAIDERGRDLHSSSISTPPPSFSLRQWSQEQLSVLSHSIPLSLPADRGRSIARLRGYVPITSVARIDEIFSSPVADLEGKTLSGGGVTMKVIRSGLTQPAQFLEVTIKGEPTPDALAFVAGPRQTSLATVRLNYGLDDHLRIEDADGVPFGSTSNATSPPAPDGTMTFRVNLMSSRPSGHPARLRYFGVAAVATEIPFDFKDLPIP
ncbi:MAG: hypothetical protein JWN86_2956 [Planctomycetota bacterium]|nr:hypothetical protein [Planctomycetota bacterium]